MIKSRQLRQALIDGVGSVLLAFAFAFVFQTTAFATYFIPSESMVPTLQVGDRLAVAKFAYGYGRFSLPYDLDLAPRYDGRVLGSEPKRGDVIVFAHPRSGERMIKRVIALPGDRVAMRDGVLVLNGKVVPRRFVRTYSFREYGGGVISVNEYVERLPDGAEHPIIEHTGREFRPDMAEIELPPGRYFMMGDNRDNSADSRYATMGTVPRANLIGRAEIILYSWYACRLESGVECAGRRIGSLIH